MKPSSPLVSVDWLRENIHLENLIILDASNETTATGKSSNYSGFFLPFARKVSIKNLSDPFSSLPNTFPTENFLNDRFRELGINNDSMVVVYDKMGIYTSPRIRWLLLCLGHSDAFVLDGGLPAWIEKGYSTTTESLTSWDNGNFSGVINPDLIKTIEEIADNLFTEESILIDARSSGRFVGSLAEPRKGLKSGHIPKSINVPYSSVLENHSMKTKEALSTLFSEFDLENKPLIFTCGSGVTACIVSLAAELTLDNSRAIYDGSWTEWATYK